jgi:hypothetical protein
MPIRDPPLSLRPPELDRHIALLKVLIEDHLEQLVDAQGPAAIPPDLMELLDALDQDSDLELEPDREAEQGDGCFWPDEGDQRWKWLGT